MTRINATDSPPGNIPPGNNVEHLKKLEEVLASESKNEFLLPCIQDLVINGLCLSRFSKNESIPSRQDITQFFIAWLLMLKIPVDVFRDWMLDYCVEVLSVLSSSSPSKIRHSTKSNIKYIYGAKISFECNCENNSFKARCSQKCPIYSKMAIKAKVKIENNRKEREKIEKANVEIKKQIEKKKLEKKLLKEKRVAGVAQKRLKKQKAFYLKFYPFVAEKQRENFSISEIVDLLNKAGYRTQKGNLWKYQNLILCLRKFKDFNTDNGDAGFLFPAKDLEMTRTAPKNSPRKSVGQENCKKATKKGLAESQQQLFPE